MKRLLTIAILVCGLFGFAVSARGSAVEFTPLIHSYDCPPDFHYEVMECIDTVTRFPGQHLELQDVGDGFFIGDWDGQGAGVLPSAAQMSFSLYPNQQGVVNLMARISAGFHSSANQNPSAFFETLPDRFPNWMLVNGERRLSGAREEEAALEYSDLKFVR